VIWCSDAAPVVSKLTLVRSKTDNMLIIKKKEPSGQVRQRRPARSRAGRALKAKRRKLDADSSVREDEEGGRQSPDERPDQDAQCKIVKVILENCKTSTTSSPSRDGVEAGAVAAPSTDEVSCQTPSTTTEPGPSTSSEAPSNDRQVAAASSAAASTAVMVTTASVPVGTGAVVTASTWLQTTQTQLSQLPGVSSTSSTTTDVTTSVLASPTPLRLTTPLNGVVNQLPLALGHHVQRLQLLRHPAAGNLPPVAGAQRWSVPLVNSAGAWLTFQPVASTSPASIAASPASFGLIPATTVAQGAPPRPEVVVDQPRQTRPYVPVAHSSVINSPIKQFLEHTRSVPLPANATDDVPTDLSMKTLRRLGEKSRDVPSASLAQAPPPPVHDDDAPLDLCTKRPSPAADNNGPRLVDVENVPSSKTPPVLPILTVPLCFPTGTGERPRVTVARQVVPATTAPSTGGSAAIKLVQPPTPLLKIDAAAVRAPTVAAAGAFPVSPITILHPAFRQLSPFLCSPLLMTPFAPASLPAASVQRHATDVCVPSTSSSL